MELRVELARGGVDKAGDGEPRINVPVAAPEPAPCPATLVFEEREGRLDCPAVRLGECCAERFVGERPGERYRFRRRQREVPARCVVGGDAFQEPATFGVLAFCEGAERRRVDRTDEPQRRGGFSEPVALRAAPGVGDVVLDAFYPKLVGAQHGRSSFVAAWRRPAAERDRRSAWTNASKASASCAQSVGVESRCPRWAD